MGSLAPTAGTAGLHNNPGQRTTGGPGPMSPRGEMSPDRVKVLIAAFRKSQLDQQISSGRKDAFGQSNPGETSRRPGGLKRLTGE